MNPEERDAITFERESRTPHSETYSIWEDGSFVGHIDLHYHHENVTATLCTTADADEERIQFLIDAVDERLVMPAEPYREDFVVTVWRGSPAGIYSDDSAGDIDDEDDEGGGSFRVGDVSRN